jgi:hypothetical protein
MPAQAIDAPIAIESGGKLQAIAIRRTSLRSVTPITVPMSATIPVNILIPVGALPLFALLRP